MHVERGRGAAVLQRGQLDAACADGMRTGADSGHGRRSDGDDRDADAEVHWLMSVTVMLPW